MGPLLAPLLAPRCTAAGCLTHCPGVPRVCQAGRHAPAMGWGGPHQGAIADSRCGRAHAPKEGTSEAVTASPPSACCRQPTPGWAALPDHPRAHIPAMHRFRVPGALTWPGMSDTSPGWLRAKPLMLPPHFSAWQTPHAAESRADTQADDRAASNAADGVQKQSHAPAGTGYTGGAGTGGVWCESGGRAPSPAPRATAGGRAPFRLCHMPACPRGCRHHCRQWVDGTMPMCWHEDGARNATGVQFKGGAEVPKLSDAARHRLAAGGRGGRLAGRGAGKSRRARRGQGRARPAVA